MTAWTMVPHVGVGSLRFGMTLEEVRAIVGDPAFEETIDWPEDTATREWTFEDPDLDLSFADEDAMRLVNITARQGLLRGVDVIGMPEEAAIAALHGAGSPPVAFAEEFATGLRVLRCEDDDLLLFVEDGVVQSIGLFPEHDADRDEWIWPD